MGKVVARARRSLETLDLIDRFSEEKNKDFTN